MTRIACYRRVSIEDQNLERKLESTNSYAQDQLGVPLGDVEVFRDKSTGTDTWQLNRGMPLEVVAEGVNTSVRVLKRHYVQPTKKEELEERRRHHLN